jgi:hypothetical protein
MIDLRRRGDGAPRPWVPFGIAALVIVLAGGGWLWLGLGMGRIAVDTRGLLVGWVFLPTLVLAVYAIDLSLANFRARLELRRRLRRVGSRLDEARKRLDEHAN